MVVGQRISQIKLKSNLLYFYIHPWVSIVYLRSFKHFIFCYYFCTELSWKECSSSIISSILYAFSFFYILVHSIYWRHWSTCTSTYILLWCRYRYKCLGLSTHASLRSLTLQLALMNLLTFPRIPRYFLIINE